MRVLAAEMRDTFQRRACEWLLASYMTIWGLVLLHDSSLFAMGSVYARMAAVATEDSWGIILYGVGAIRIVALLINGTMRPCAHIRTALGIAAAVMWMMLAFEMLSTRQPSAQAWGCLTFVFFDLWNATRAAVDAARADALAGGRSIGG